MANKAGRLFWMLLLAWLVCNFIEAIYMEVMSDEAYYAIYGEHLAWGYYDHPPVVALLSFFSRSLFAGAGNLSIRFGTVLLHACTIWIVWKTLADRANMSRVLLFFAISFSFIMFSTYGFVLTPDGALLFFTAAFLYVYKQFLEKESWGNAILLTLTMTGMFYSKYHAVLVIGFVVLSNLRLLLKPKFWFCILMTGLLFLPHIYWQVTHDYPSFTYHLVTRSQGVKLANVLKYFPEQFVVFSPVALVAILYLLIKKRPKDVFERGLYFMIAGMLIFFQVMTLKGRVEPHWTVAATIPMILLLYKNAVSDARFGRLLWKGTLWVLPLIVIARIVLMMDLLPRRLAFNGKEKESLAIEQVAGTLPVVFEGSFQRPSLYHYFTGHPSFVLSSCYSRQTQYDILGLDKDYQDSTVFVCMDRPGAKSYTINGFEFKGLEVKHLQTTNRIRIAFSDVPKEVSIGDTLRIRYTVTNPYRKDIRMDHPELPVEFSAVFDGPDAITTGKCLFQPAFNIIKAGETMEGELVTVVPAVTPSSTFFFGLTLQTPISFPRNSPFVKMIINEK